MKPKSGCVITVTKHFWGWPRLEADAHSPKMTLASSCMCLNAFSWSFAWWNNFFLSHIFRHRVQKPSAVFFVKHKDFLLSVELPPLQWLCQAIGCLEILILRRFRPALSQHKAPLTFATSVPELSALCQCQLHDPHFHLFSKPLLNASHFSFLEFVCQMTTKRKLFKWSSSQSFCLTRSNDGHATLIASCGLPAWIHFSVCLFACSCGLSLKTQHHFQCQSLLSHSLFNCWRTLVRND